MFRTLLIVCVGGGVGGGRVVAQVYRLYVYAKCVYVCVCMYMYAVRVLILFFVLTRYLISAWLQSPPPPSRSSERI